jgi:hypothetical protein
LPDLSGLENLTVNFQANTFSPAPDNSLQIQELAENTDARMGHLRQELVETLARGNSSFTERFQMMGNWCQEVYACQ